MRIVIDMQGAQTGSRFRGIGRYTMAWSQAMVRNAGGHEIILVLNGMFPQAAAEIKRAFSGLLAWENIRTWYALPPVRANDARNVGRRHVAEAIREDFIKKMNPDVLYVTSLFEGFDDDAVHTIKTHIPDVPTAAAFYDVIPLIQRDLYLDPHAAFKRHYLEKIGQIQKADLLLAISGSSRQEAIDHLKFPGRNVVNVSSAVDAKFYPRSYEPGDSRKMHRRLGISKQFIMYSGATDDRKNHRGLIDAYALLPRSVRRKYQLVLVGKLPEIHRQHFESHVKKNRLTLKDVVITGGVSDDDLIHLYNTCNLYVFPSWHEGFGLPALEAMACGAPTIGSNTTSVPEVIGLERALFDPHSVESMAGKMLEALSDDAFRAELKAHGLRQAGQFSWDETAHRSLRAMEDLHARSAAAPPARNAAAFDLIEAIAKTVTAGKAEVNLLKLSQAIASNSRKPKLLVDASELVQRDSRSGIQRVVRSILREWLTQAYEHFDVYPVYATSAEQGYRYANTFRKKFLAGNTSGRLFSAVEDLPVDFEPGDTFIGLDMQHWVQTYQAPFYETLRGEGIGTYFVLYDLLPISAPQFFSHAVSAAHTPWVKTLVQADGVVCISQAVASELDGWLDENRADVSGKPGIHWFHMGADITGSMPSTGLPADAPDMLERLASAPTFLIVSTLEPRKGHEQALDAVEQLWQDGIDVNLAFVGKPGWKVEALIERLQSHPQRNRRLFWPQEVSDEYLQKIYEASTCLIAASYGEGFGLPLIEAAQHKLPIIARDIPVFREVAGEHACYFNAAEPAELAQALRGWLALYHAGEHPRSDAMPWLTWKQSAARLMEILVDESKKRAVTALPVRTSDSFESETIA